MSHKITLPIRWGDMDAFQHLNNAAYFRFLEEARIHWLNSLGVLINKEIKTGPLVIKAECTFLKPVVYPASLVISTVVDNIGRSSIETKHRIHVNSDIDAIYAEAQVKLVWVDYEKGKSIAIPENVRSKLEPLN